MKTAQELKSPAKNLQELYMLHASNSPKKEQEKPRANVKEKPIFDMEGLMQKHPDFINNTYQHLQEAENTVMLQPKGEIQFFGLRKHLSTLLEIESISDQNSAQLHESSVPIKDKKNSECFPEKQMIQTRKLVTFGVDSKQNMRQSLIDKQANSVISTAQNEFLAAFNQQLSEPSAFDNRPETQFENDEIWEREIAKLRQLQSQDHIFIQAGLLARDNIAKEPLVTRVGRAAAIEKLFAFVSGNDDGLNDVYAAVVLLDRFFASDSLKIIDKDDVNLTAFMSLYIAVEEVGDLGMEMQTDLIDGLLDRFGEQRVEQKESQLKQIIGSVFSSVYLLDYISIIGVLLRKISNHEIALSVEKMVQELAKSVLIDAHLHQYCQSLIVAGLYSASFQILLRRKLAADNVDDHRSCSHAWERILFALFGKQAVKHIDHFGRYIVIRQQKIYHKYSDGYQNQIYNNEAQLDGNLYKFDYFLAEYHPEFSDNEDVFEANQDMDASFSTTLQWC